MGPPSGLRGVLGRAVLVEVRGLEPLTLCMPCRCATSCTTPPTGASSGAGGAGTPVPATRETPEQFRSVIDVNLNGCYWMAQACGRVMQPGSSIVNISSVLGITTGGLPQAAYSASKAGLNGLTRDLAQQWTERKGIRVNSIAPGFFTSEMTDTYPDGYLDLAMQRVPARRKGDPAELAATVVFLASPAAGYITGQTLPVDGGMTIA